MIKYADRGLINSKGSVSPLFEILYLLVCVSLFSVFSIFAFFYYLSQDPEQKSNFHLMCINQSVDSALESMKSLHLMFALTFPFFVILISMFCSIIYFLRARGIQKKIPQIIGNYRRNVLTLREIFYYTIFILLLFFMNFMLLKFHTVFGFSVNGIRMHFFTHSLVTHQLLEGIIWPSYVLWNLCDKMPEFYSDKTISMKKFYMFGQNNMEPRRFDENMQAMYYRRNKSGKYQSDFTFLQNQTRNHSHSFSELPPIV